MERLELVNSHMPWLFSLFFFLFGACVGSFLNVCVCRLPSGRSIVKPRSRCACGKNIAWYDNLPILSWFVLRGKARCCGGRFSFRYPFIEFLTACAFLFCWLNFPVPYAFVAMFFFSLMLVVTFVDIDTLELPDILTVGGIVAGLLLSCIFPSIHVAVDDGGSALYFVLKSLMLSSLGAVVGAGLLFIFKIMAEYLLRREAMGDGDIVLLACIGAFCGWQGALFSIFGGSLIGAILMLPILAYFKIFKKGPESEMIPYGPWLAIGAVAYMFFFKPAVDSHLAQFMGVFFK